MNQIHSPGPMEHNPFTGRPINGRLLLTISEAAAALRISRSSIYSLRKIAGHGSLITTQRYLHPDRQSVTRCRRTAVKAPVSQNRTQPAVV